MPTLAENAVVASLAWIGEKVPRSWRRLCRESGHPGNIKTCHRGHVLFAAMLIGPRDS